MSTVRKLAIGRIVQFVDHAAPDRRPAIVTHVHSATCVDLVVFGSRGVRPAEGVARVEHTAYSDGPTGWEWPPLPVPKATR